jgi:formate hydrogenlyase subunit 6/NADH:ubiquinone oxidoreductase subunit I
MKPVKLTTMFSDVLRSIVRKPITRLYPVEQTPTPDRLRGKLTYDPSQCTGCGLCTKDCPADAIELITLDKAAKRFVLRYSADRCTYCGQCVESCRFNCIALDHNQWELASVTKTPFTIYYGDKADVEQVVEQGSEHGMDRTTAKESDPQP